jgi:hypothetical protein
MEQVFIKGILMIPEVFGEFHLHTRALPGCS